MANIDDKKIPVGTTETPIVGRLHDVSEDHVVTGANEVYDDAFGERQSQINDKLRHYTKMAHIRIDAEEITREHNDNNLNEQINAKQLEIGAVETDIEPILESPNMLPSGAVAFNLGWYRGNENPEWVYCITDGAMRVLAGIKKDGSVEWMVGVPTPVKNYVDTHIQELIERLEELEEHILEELEKKVDKEEGKSLINKDYADGITYVENPEFIEVKLDDEERILEATMKNGKKLFSAGINVHGEIDFEGNVSSIVNNPEFIAVWLTGNNKILLGFNRDGDLYFGYGVPHQVKDYIKKSIEELPFDEKVDKEEGKSLINAEYAEGIHYVKSPNFVEVKLDKDDRILEATMLDGTKLLPAGYEVGGNAVKTINNPEYLSAWVDNANHILFALKSNGDVVFGCGIPSQIKELVSELIEMFHYENNTEFVDIKLDSEGKILEGIKKDGTKVIGGDLKVLGNVNINDVTYFIASDTEWLKAVIDSENKIICGIKKDGTFCVVDIDFFDPSTKLKQLFDSVDFVDSTYFLSVELDKEERILGGRKKDGIKFENVGFDLNGVTSECTNDPEERMEVKTDHESKIISCRKKDGTLVENVGIETTSLKINGVELSDYVGKTANYVGEKTFVYSEKPKFGEIRLYGSLPTDTSDARIPEQLDIIFKVNNNSVFSAKCNLSIQGHGSAQYAKKGYTLDFINDSGEELSVKFGNMPAVDSFHLKGYATDRTHSRGIAGANIFRDMVAQLDYPYNKFNNIPLNISSSQKKDSLFIYDARYGEDGFPNVVYLNDEFLGIYTIKLKKSRQNYAMMKDDKNEIFLDSISYTAYLNEPFDYSDWELKNPKIKNYEEGGEITDATVLANIQRLFGFTSDLANRYNDYADFIVLPHWVCWYIFVNLVGHYDTSGNNMELLTWDGTHWSIIPYDMDLTVGLNAWANYTIEDSKTGFIGGGTFFDSFRTLFGTDISNIYTMLRKSGFITVDNIYSYYLNQCSSIPRDYQQEDKTKWENIWTNGYPTVEQIYSYINSRIEYLDTVWYNN